MSVTALPGITRVTVGELAAAADVTTGALYHHFRNKMGLYLFVRADVEQRLLDRMAGAAAASGRISDVLLVGFDYAIREQFTYLLGQTPPDGRSDPVTDFVAELLDSLAIDAEAGIVVAAWRAALLADADGAERIRIRTTLRRIVGGLDHDPASPGGVGH
ncbi:TetR/AcrR family transcriptional regulator [Gordonia mangrovi]|nr:TetR/AcrR family transcriptional regulator [Gordonia mangrovi]UVF78675.1 TetR/AcrR family transcriptional regulator [Gordonia mangrovi]